MVRMAMRQFASLNQSDPASFSQAASFSQVAANGAPVRLTGRGNRRGDATIDFSTFDIFLVHYKEFSNDVFSFALLNTSERKLTKL